jgi:hypothetical protein
VSTITVRKGLFGTTLEDALRKARAGDEIVVGRGITHNGNLTLSVPLRIRAEEPGSVLIQGRVDIYAVVDIAGVVLHNASTFAVWVARGATVTLQQCALKSDASNAAAISIVGQSVVTLDECVFVGAGAGVQVSQASRLTIERSAFRELAGVAISVSERGSQAAVRDTTFDALPSACVRAQYDAEVLVERWPDGTQDTRAHRCCAGWCAVHR